MKHNEFGCWSELPKELLEMIFKRVSLMDILRIKSVCSSWSITMRSYTNSPCYSPSSQITPLLMFPKNGRADKTCRLFNLEENKCYHLNNVRPYDDSNYEVVGSSYGWLVIFTKAAGNPYIINPFSSCSSCIVRLPDEIESEHKIINFLSISKAIIPSDVYSTLWVVVIYGLKQNKLGFFKHGDETWTHLGGVKGASEMYVDIICHNGLLYALRNGGLTLIEVWDFLSPSPKKVMDLEFSPTVRQLVKDNVLLVDTKAFFVESMGELLFVLPLIGDQSIEFVVYKLDYSGKRWVTVETLFDQALFISKRECISVYTRNLPQVSGNSIYLLEKWDLTMDCTIGIYNLKERRLVNKTYAMEKCGITSEPFWFVPNAWILHDVDPLPLRQQQDSFLFQVNRRKDNWEMPLIRQKPRNRTKNILSGQKEENDLLFYCECCLSRFDTPLIHNELEDLRVCIQCLKLLRSLNGFLGVKYPLQTPFKYPMTWMLFKYRYTTLDMTKKMTDLAQYYRYLNPIMQVFYSGFAKIWYRDGEGDQGEGVIKDMIENRSSEMVEDNFISVYAPCLIFDQRVVSSCTLRVYTQQMVFIAYVATLEKFRRRGFCKALIGKLQVMLSELGIKVILVSASNSTAECMWRKFGYTHMEVAEKIHVTTRFHIDVSDTTLLHKKL